MRPIIRGREALVDQQPVAGVLRRVGHEHHLAAHVERAVRGLVQLDHVDAPRLGAEPLGVAVDEPEVGVLGDRPEPGAVGFVAPVHRILCSEHAEHLVMFHALETVHVEQIDVVELHEAQTLEPVPVIPHRPPVLCARTRRTRILRHRTGWPRCQCRASGWRMANHDALTDVTARQLGLISRSQARSIGFQACSIRDLIVSAGSRRSPMRSSRRGSHPARGERASRLCSTAGVTPSSHIDRSRVVGTAWVRAERDPHREIDDVLTTIPSLDTASSARPSTVVGHRPRLDPDRPTRALCAPTSATEHPKKAERALDTFWSLRLLSGAVK